MSDKTARRRIPTDVEILKQIESAVFDDGGEALKLVRAYARYQLCPPLSFLVLYVQQCLASLPISKTHGVVMLHTGAGSPSAPALFSAVAGFPGQGKDNLNNEVSRVARVFVDDQGYTPNVRHLSSGEGIEELLLPDEDGNRNPVFFWESEVTKLTGLAKRQGNTLTATLLPMFSGASFGSSTRMGAKTVEPGSYHASLSIGVQPNMAGMLLDTSGDAGLTHRLVWLDACDPVRELGSKYLEPERALVPISVSSRDLAQGFTVPEAVTDMLRYERERTLCEGSGDDGQGHRNLVQARLAAGLALIRSATKITMDDWERAGHIMRYSIHVRSAVEKAKLDAEVASQIEEENRASDARRRKIFDHFKKHLTDQPQHLYGTGGFVQKAHSRQRAEVDSLVKELAKDNIVSLTKDQSGVSWVATGPNWGDLVNG